MTNLTHLRLGASLYVPAVREDLVEVALAQKLANARSVIFCTEDSVSESDLPQALENLRHMLPRARRSSSRMLFIRPRNPKVLYQLLEMPGIENIDGFVLPKATAYSMPQYLGQLSHAEFGTLPPFWLMPTLETREVFDPHQMRQLMEVMLRPGVRERILVLRIGGNDLLNVLGVRRSRQRTLYESPLGPTIANLVTMFKPEGFHLTSPVCELLYDHEVLQRELALDVEHGLVGKTAIHPDQVAIIEQAYRPVEQDVQMAEAILADNAPAVFNMHGTMCEVATHHEWAQQVLARRQLYGVYGKKAAPVRLAEAA